MLKKFLFIVAFITLILTMSACGGGNNTATNTPLQVETTNPSQSATPVAPAPILTTSEQPFELIQISLPMEAPSEGTVPFVIATDQAGSGGGLAVTDDGGLWVWGDIRARIIGRNGDMYPIQIMENVTAAATGVHATMAITADGNLWTLGSPGGLILGQAYVRTHGYATLIKQNVAQVSVTYHMYMAITKDGVLWAWGSNENGRLGDGTTEHRHDHPVQIMENVTYVSTASDRTMAITADGTLWGCA